MPEDLKVSQIGSSPLPPPFRGLHSPGVRKHCQIIFACYFRKSSIGFRRPVNCTGSPQANKQRRQPTRDKTLLRSMSHTRLLKSARPEQCSLRLSFLSRKVAICGHCLVTLSLTMNEILKWLSSMPISMHELFWW